jgi:hypothetical protein
VHAAEEALSWTSIAILAAFNAELLAKLLVFGLTYFTHSRWAARGEGNGPRVFVLCKRRVRSVRACCSDGCVSLADSLAGVPTRTAARQPWSCLR